MQVDAVLWRSSVYGKVIYKNHGWPLRYSNCPITIAMPFPSTHPCDFGSFSEFYETDENRDAFYSKPNTVLKRNYVIGLTKEKKACLQGEITKKYNALRQGRLGFNPIPKWTWYAIRFAELSSPMNLHTGREISSDKPPKNDDIAMPRPAVSLKRRQRVKRNHRSSRLRVVAAMIAENKQQGKDGRAFPRPLSLHDWTLLTTSCLHENKIIAATAAHRGVLKREREIRLGRKRREHLRCSREEFLVESLA